MAPGTIPRPTVLVEMAAGLLTITSSQKKMGEPQAILDPGRRSSLQRRRFEEKLLADGARHVHEIVHRRPSLIGYY